ncbi:DNA-binding SARP family transcriptional activator [Rhodococcus sp. OK519]|uniref:BTAD domain-containing putative transcriptional regulator n=1 Tax=Rhodococcus sp. OK519 TaxID=2135729 RepID=UPI000D384AA1|nr:DNA-binding SARP family transcriptional activator [Rhodococcus sp. OK519]
MSTTFGVLGPTSAWDDKGRPVALRGPRHRAVLARLLAARGRVVPLGVLIDDLWEDPPDGAPSAVRTFVAALRRSLEPDRPPRAAATLLVTEGPGYAIRPDPDAVDAWNFERMVTEAAALPPAHSRQLLDAALASWRGPAYADVDEMDWARSERARLEQLRLVAVERRAEALLALDRAADAVPDLDAHVTEHPWREEGWRLLGLALYRCGRQGESLAVLRRARALLADDLGIDPSPALTQLEVDVLQQNPALTPARGGTGTEQVFTAAAAAYHRVSGAGSRAQLESAVSLLRSLAVTGGAGLTAAREQRLATITAAEQLGDPVLTARVIGSYDVPGVWARSDDPEQAARVVAAARRALTALPDGNDSVRSRLLAVIAMESRGTRDVAAVRAAAESERLARDLDDPALLAHALSGVFMQSFHRCGLAPERDSIGCEVLALARRHALVNFEVLGHLIRMQALGGLGRFDDADREADAAEALGAMHERPLVAPFVAWYRAMRRSAIGIPWAEAESEYHSADRSLAGSGMPGVDRGILPLALLCLRVWQRRPLAFDPGTDWGPYEPWARPLILLAEDDRDRAAAAARSLPDPPADHLAEALWALTATAAVAVNDTALMRRSRDALVPAAGQIAGASSGLLTAGPVDHYLAMLSDALG